MILLDFAKTSERWQEWGKYYHDKAEKYYLEIDKTALAIATFLLGFIGIFLQVSDPTCLKINQKILLGSGFIFISISVIFGIIQLMSLNKFLNNAGDYYEELSERLIAWMQKNGRKSGVKYPKEIYKGLKLQINSDNKTSYLQLYSLIGGFLCIVGYLILFLF